MRKCVCVCVCVFICPILYCVIPHTYPHFQTDLEMSVESVHGQDDSLDFPKRPPWDFSLSKEQLENQEQSYFQVCWFWQSAAWSTGLSANSRQGLDVSWRHRHLASRA